MRSSIVCHSWSQSLACTYSLGSNRKPPHIEVVPMYFAYADSCCRRPVGRVSFDDRSGDFIEYNNPIDINLRTLFFFRKPFPPRIDPCSLIRPVPYQPAPVTAYSLAWMWGGAALTGAQLDAIAGGPNRPAPPKPPPVQRKPLISWGRPVDEPPAKVDPADAAIAKRTAVGKQKAPTRDLRERDDA